MEHRPLGKSGLLISAIGYGCMGLSGAYGKAVDCASVNVLRRALDMGITLFDTADVYGNGHNEELVGNALKNVRQQVVLATKGGFIECKDGSMMVNGDPKYIRMACEASLKRLDFDYIDLYYLHRVDPSVPIEDSMGGLASLVKDGKIRFVGLSQTDPDTLKRAHAIHPITALQSEYSLWVRNPEKEIIPTCTELSIGFIPFCPLGRGFLTGKIHSVQDLTHDDLRRTVPRLNDSNMEINEPLLRHLEKFSHLKSCKPAQLALTWLLHKSGNIIPIPGSRLIEHLEENIGATALTLSREEIQDIEDIFLPERATGSSRPSIVQAIESGNTV